jgi:predicted 3-demethylubiquinone-9 3-methyltransferase (glyoxalase superfamily)
MADKPIVPCLWLDDQAEEAARFYTRTFPGSRTTAVSRYPASFDNPGRKPRGSVMTVEVELAGQPFTLLNGGPVFTINPSVSFFVHATAGEEATRLFSALAEGGKVLMPLDAYPWSERYGWAQDRFGVSWQVIAGRPAPGGATLVPALMFTGPQAGRAEEAMRAYTAVFPGGRIADLARYGEGEGPVGSVKLGRFLLAGQDLAAMDSHYEHGFTFNEAVSLRVMCADQAEVDRYWGALSEGGTEGPCGWLKDRYGLSWQVVPRSIEEWIASPDEAARDRAFRAMLGMKKLDVAALRAAFEGK